MIFFLFPIILIFLPGEGLGKSWRCAGWETTPPRFGAGKRCAGTCCWAGTALCNAGSAPLTSLKPQVPPQNCTPSQDLHLRRCFGTSSSTAQFLLPVCKPGKTHAASFPADLGGGGTKQSPLYGNKPSTETVTKSMLPFLGVKEAYPYSLQHKPWRHLPSFMKFLHIILHI